MRILFITVLMLSMLAGHPAFADDASEKMARINALSDRVKELERQQTEVQSHIAATGHADTAEQGIEHTQAHYDDNQRQMDALQPVLDLYKVTHEDLNRMRHEVATKNLYDFSDAGEKARDEAGQRALEGGLKAVGKTEVVHLVGPLSWLGDAAEHFGKWTIRYMSSQELQEIVVSQGVQMVQLAQFMVVLENERNEDLHTIAHLRELKKEYDKIQEDLIPARRRLEEMVKNDANLTRETDAAGDAELQRQQDQEHAAPPPPGRHIRIRACGPSDGPRNFGVRQARKDGGAPAQKEGEDKTVAEKDAAADQCVDLAGKWTYQTISYLSPKAMPPVHVEFAVTKEGTAEEAPAFDVFMPDRERAKNGPWMRCTQSGLQLSCQVQALSASCPPEKQAWNNMDLTVAGDGSNMSGDLALGYATDTRGKDRFCTATAITSPGKVSYSFVPAE